MEIIIKIIKLFNWMWINLNNGLEAIDNGLEAVEYSK